MEKKHSLGLFKAAVNAFLLHGGSLLGRLFRRRLFRQAKNGKSFSEKKLLRLLKKSRNTEYGKKYGFREIKNVDDYREKVPLSTYDDYRELIRRTAEKGEQKLMTGRKIVYFATTSGTVTEVKLIPQILASYLAYFEFICIILNDLTVSLRSRGVKRTTARGLLLTEISAKPASEFVGGEEEIPAGGISSFAASGVGIFLPLFTPLPKEVLGNSGIRDMKYIKARYALQDPTLKWYGGPFMSAVTDLVEYMEEHHEMLSTFNRWIGDDKNHTKIGAEQISSKELQLQHKLEETNDPTTRALLTAQLAGLSKAKDFITRLEELSADRTNIEDDIQDVKDRIAELSAKQYKDRNDEMKLQSLREQLDGLTQKLHDTIGDVVKLYDYVSDDLSYLTAEGHMQFLERFKKEQEHTDEIIHFVNSDLQGVPTAPDAAKEGDYRSFKNSYLAPLRTFVHELRKYGVNAAGGEGYLYNYFALNCWQARSNYLKNRNERKAMLDAKAEELFGRGMTWDKVMREYSNQLTDVTIEWLKRESKTDEAGIPEKAEPVQQTLTNGQIMYIYMCNKMSDGQTKLREMNISDEEVAALKEKLPKKLVELADWIQDVYFPTTRVRYNETNMFLFGTPMAEIPHYVPLKISQQDVTNAKADVAQGDFKTLPSNVVGSAINRTYNRNSIAIDKTDAMELVWENTKEMEQWSAYAGLIKDINILLRSKSFRNKINHMNPNNYDNFFDVARLAVVGEVIPFHADAMVGNSR